MRHFTLLMMMIVGFLVMESATQNDFTVFEGLNDPATLQKATALLNEIIPDFEKIFVDWPPMRAMFMEALATFGESSTYTADPTKWNGNLPNVVNEVVSAGQVTRKAITDAMARALHGISFESVGSAMSKVWRFLADGVASAETAIGEAMSTIGVEAAAVAEEVAFEFTAEEALAVLAVALI